MCHQLLMPWAAAPRYQQLLLNCLTEREQDCTGKWWQPKLIAIRVRSVNFTEGCNRKRTLHRAFPRTLEGAGAWGWGAMAKPEAEQPWGPEAFARAVLSLCLRPDNTIEAWGETALSAPSSTQWECVWEGRSSTREFYKLFQLLGFRNSCLLHN